MNKDRQTQQTKREVLRQNNNNNNKEKQTDKEDEQEGTNGGAQRKSKARPLALLKSAIKMKQILHMDEQATPKRHKWTDGLTTQ